MNEYKDIKEMLKPRREIKASEAFRSKIEDLTKKHRRSSLAKRWVWGGLSLSAAAVMLIIMLIPTRISAKEILRSAITAIGNTTNIEMTVEIRTLSKDNFSYMNPDSEFITHDIKIMRSDSLTYWSINKEGRAAEKNSKGVFMWIKEFDIGWQSTNPNWNVLNYLSILMNPEKVLESELQLVLSDQGSDYNIRKRNGNIYLTVYGKAKGNFANPYMLNKSIAESNNIRRYVIDADTHRLKSATVSMLLDNKEIEVLKITDIKYNPDNFQLLSIPSNINFIDIEDSTIQMGIQGLNERETALALFNAFTTWNKDILYKLLDPVIAESAYRQLLEGAKLLKLGTPFKSGNNENMTFIPYTIRLKNDSIRSMNLVLVKSSQGGWSVNGGL